MWFLFQVQKEAASDPVGPVLSKIKSNDKTGAKSELDAILKKYPASPELKKAVAAFKKKVDEKDNLKEIAFKRDLSDLAQCIANVPVEPPKQVKAAPADSSKTSNAFVAESAKTAQAKPLSAEFAPNSAEWIDWQAGLAERMSVLLTDYSGFEKGSTLKKERWTEIKQASKDLAYNLTKLDASKLDKADQDRLAKLIEYSGSLRDQLNKWGNLSKGQAGTYAANMDEISAILEKAKEKQQPAVEEEKPATKAAEKKNETLQQKLKVVPIDIVKGAREHMMSMNEDAKSDFRAKGLRMDTAGANQKFAYALGIASKYAGLDVALTIGKDNRLLVSNEDEAKLSSITGNQRAALFAIADMVAIRGEGNTKALMEKLTGGANWSTDEFLTALWHEGASHIVGEMGLKSKGDISFWSDHFKKVVSGLAPMEAPKKEEKKVEGKKEEQTKGETGAKYYSDVAGIRKDFRQRFLTVENGAKLRTSPIYLSGAMGKINNELSSLLLRRQSEGARGLTADEVNAVFGKHEPNNAPPTANAREEKSFDFGKQKIVANAQVQKEQKPKAEAKLEPMPLKFPKIGMKAPAELEEVPVGKKPALETGEKSVSTARSETFSIKKENEQAVVEKKEGEQVEEKKEEKKAAQKPAEKKSKESEVKADVTYKVEEEESQAIGVEWFDKKLLGDKELAKAYSEMNDKQKAEFAGRLKGYITDGTITEKDFVPSDVQAEIADIVKKIK